MRQQPDRRRAHWRTALDAVCFLAVTLPLLGPSLAAASAAPNRDRSTQNAEPDRLALEAADVYAFVSPDRPDTVTIISTWLSPTEENGQRGTGAARRSTAPPRLFATGAHYDINIDNDGDGTADRTYRWTFADATAPSAPRDMPATPFTQRYTLEQRSADAATTTLVRDGRTAPAEPARPSMPGYLGLREQALVYLNGGARAFAGQADDPSFQDLAALATAGTPNADDPAGRRPRQNQRNRPGKDLRAGHNVNVLALQVPKYWLARDTDDAANPVIGVWSSAEAASPSGGGSSRWTQVSRAGNPLVTELLPAELRGALRSQQPRQDSSVRALSQALAAPVLPPILRRQPAGTIPRTPRDDLVEIYLTGISDRDGPLRTPLNSQLMNAAARPERFVRSEQLRLNLSVRPTGRPNRLGLPGGDRQGYPNGRRLGDDVVDIQLQFLAGAASSGHLVEAVGAGDRIDTNDVPFAQRFPYVALPHPRSLPQVQAAPAEPQNTAPADDATHAETSYAPLILALFAAVGLVLTTTAGWMLHRLRRSEQDRPDPSERQW